MTNPTSNFGWQMPTSTDLVTDLPADFETFGQAVDTSLADLKGGTTGQVLTKNSNTDMDFVWSSEAGDISSITASSPLTGGGTTGAVTVGIQDGTTAQKGAVQLENSTSSTSTTTAAVPASVKSAYDLAAAAVPKSTVTTNGDLIYGTGSGAVTRLGIGTTGQVLSVSGGIPAWATASSANIDWVLVSNTTTNTGTSYTISGLGSYKKLRIFYSGVSNTNTNGARLRFRMNGDTGSNYNAYVIDFNSQSAATLTNEARLNQTSLELAKQGTASASDTLSGYIFIDGCDGTGDKIGWQQGASNQASTQARGIMGGFRYDASAGISNVTFYFDTDSFDAGTVSIYGSLN